MSSADREWPFFEELNNLILFDDAQPEIACVVMPGGQVLSMENNKWLLE